MPSWKKTSSQTETVRTERASWRFYFADDASPQPRALRMVLDVEVDAASGKREMRTLDVSLLTLSAFNPGDRNQLEKLLEKLRDAGLEELGFTQTQGENP